MNMFVYRTRTEPRIKAFRIACNAQSAIAGDQSKMAHARIQGVRALVTVMAIGMTAFAPAAVAQTAGPGVAPPAAGQPRAAVPAPAAPAPVAPAMAGVWIDHTGRGAVEITPCERSLCGRIVWMKEPLDKRGKPLVDSLNEDTRLRRRPICGLQIIGGLKAMRDGSWDAGWIYDPEQGESFDVELRLRAPDVLQVTGYKGLKFLSETFQWRRAAAPLSPGCPAKQGPA